jgi:molybdopterin biosynthesis enzyme
LLAGLGIAEPTVSPRIRVAHFVAGNEIIAPSQTPLLGPIRDTNSTLVAVGDTIPGQGLATQRGDTIYSASCQALAAEQFDRNLGLIQPALTESPRLAPPQV